MTVLDEKWDWEISNRNHAEINLRELWSYRYLLYNLVKKDTLLTNQQTILGPLWLVFQPLLTLGVHLFVFSRLMGIATNTIPPVLFFYSGIILWNLFSDCFNGTASTFKDNIHIFSKVYLPRLVMPISVVFTQFFRFLIQLALFFLLIAGYSLFGGYHLPYGWQMVFFPLAVILVACFGLALGLLCSTLAARYKDLFHFLGVIIRMLMFLTPVFYPVSSLDENLEWLIYLNPLTSLFELFRYVLLGEGVVKIPFLLMNSLFILALLFLSVRQFKIQSNKILDVI